MRFHLAIVDSCSPIDDQMVEGIRANPDITWALATHEWELDQLGAPPNVPSFEVLRWTGGLFPQIGPPCKQNYTCGANSTGPTP